MLLAEALGSVPSTYIDGSLQPSTNSSSKSSNGLFWPPWAPGTHKVHIETHKQNTFTDKINKSNVRAHIYFIYMKTEKLASSD